MVKRRNTDHSGVYEIILTNLFPPNSIQCPVRCHSKDIQIRLVDICYVRIETIIDHFDPGIHINGYIRKLIHICVVIPRQGIKGYIVIGIIPYKCENSLNNI